MYMHMKIIYNRTKRLHNQFSSTACLSAQYYFSIERDSGLVRVNQSLDHATIARYHATVKAVDNAGSADQTATGACRYQL